MRKDAAAIAREVLDGNLYMTLATADAAGRPWATPVFFTADVADTVLLGLLPRCAPLAQHHRAAGGGHRRLRPAGPRRRALEAVYMTGRAALVGDDELEVCAGIYGTRLSEARRFSTAELRAPAPFRLYLGRQSSATTSCCAAVIPRTPAARTTASPSSCGERPRTTPKPAH